MGHVLHRSATTTEAIRRAIQNSEESPSALLARYGFNQKTVAKWRKRTSVADLPTGPKDAKSTVQTRGEEAIIVACQHRLLPVDDCLCALQWRCCTTLTVGDSHWDSMRLGMPHAQAITRPLPPTNGSSYTASLKTRGSLLIWLDKEIIWLALHDCRPGRPAVFSDAAIRFCLTLKVLFTLSLR